MKSRGNYLNLLVILVFSAPPAWALGDVLVVGVGNCESRQLLEAVVQVESALASRAASARSALDSVRSKSSSAIDDPASALKALRDLMYRGRWAAALATAQSLSTALAGRRAPTSDWPSYAAARANEAYILRAQSHDASAVWLELVAIEPGFQLDAEVFPPSAIRALEEARALSARLPHAKIDVTTPTAGARVFVGGRSVGQTPWSGQYPLGQYRLEVVDGDRASFVRDFALERDVSFAVDVAAEASLRNSTPLCMDARPDVVRGFARLAHARYLLTVRAAGDSIRGEFSATDGVVALPRHAEFPWERAAALAALAAESPLDGLTLPRLNVPTPPAPAVAASSHASGVRAPPHPARILSIVALSLGGGLLAGGGVAFALGAPDRAAVQRFRGAALPTPGDANWGEAQRAFSSVRTNDAVAFTLLASGVGACIAGGFGLWLYRARPSILVSPNGATASLTVAY